MKYRFKETGKVYELSSGGFVNAEIPKYKRFLVFHISSIDFTDFFEPIHDVKEGMWVKFSDGAATEQEIKDHLIREAEARGFVGGVKYRARNKYGMLLGDIRTIKNKPAKFEYSPKEDVLYDNDYAIYVAGVWSEVIKAPKTIVVDGHELEIVTSPSAPHIKIGGKCYNLYEIRSIRNKMIEFSIESVEILGNLMTREDLAKIVRELENAEN